MSRAQRLRALVKQRLDAAADDIVALFERTMEEYEAELGLQRKRRRDGQPEDGQPEDGQDGQVSPVNIKKITVKKAAPPEQQELRSPGQDQEYPKPSQVKDELDKLWASPEGEQLEGQEDLIIIPVTVKIEEEVEENIQSPEHLYDQSVESSGQLKVQAYKEDRGGPEPATNLDLGPVETSSKTRDSSDGPKQSGKPQSVDPVSDPGSNLAKKPFSCSECGKRFGGKNHLQSHMKSHTGEKTCPFCGKKISKSSNFTTHLRVHTGEKPFTCSVCNTSFSLRNTLVNHMRVHTGEKPFSCSVCAKKFTNKANVITHMAVHSEEKPFKCNVCDKRFTWHSQVKKHKCVAESSKPLKPGDRDASLDGVA